ncbi:hypothetical protein BDU57DRAFT_508714 [Ampelomyces quisqualis]|uniref:Uncharacterized protein n=1 Tax=Ampelomyces quisqualis TaxID=50730 RepID=A0A6A5R005_AMPQU|nr:hypothetical protein BDU57DRAFT_508714 [Ampelomyces quisqualis]
MWTGFVDSRVIPAYHRFLQHQGRDGLDLWRMLWEGVDDWVFFSDTTHTHVGLRRSCSRNLVRTQEHGLIDCIYPRT